MNREDDTVNINIPLYLNNLEEENWFKKGEQNSSDIDGRNLKD